MSEMIERVARAICRRWHETDYEGENVDRLIDREWSAWKPIAIAAIAAMREPVPGMTDAGYVASDDLHTMYDAWQAMIDAALAE